MKFLRLLIVPVLFVAMSACSGDSSSDLGYGSNDGGSSSTPTDGATDTPTDEPTPAGPDCSDVWEDGATLPVDYAGCVVDGVQGREDSYDCLDGSRLVVFVDAMYAVTGETITSPDVAPLQDTEEYGEIYATCTGE